MSDEIKEEQTLKYDNTPVEETPKKKLPKVAKVFIWIIGVIVGLFITVWGGLNVAKYPIYSTFYKMKKDLCTIPGLNSGTVPQGCTYSDTYDCIYTSSYSKEYAYIYTVKDGNTIAHKLSKNNQPFHGHVGGIATSGNYIYIANGSTVYTVEASQFNDTSKEIIEIGNGIAVNSEASFIFSDDAFIYVGEFHDGGQYNIEGHEYLDNHAVVEKYKIEAFNPGCDSSTPEMVISIGNKVQGFCLHGNEFITSTSYGLASSHFYVYDSTKLVDTHQTMFGAALWAMPKEERKIKAPAMMEDLDIYKDGTVITLTESACNKYIFGKFFFANHVLSLKF